ncbi:hypothetical protein HK097_004201, partial [Rhizophlyctis rosea]
MYIDLRHLTLNRDYHQRGFKHLNSVINRITKRARSAAEDKTTYTVTYKPNSSCIAPSGNTHDYYSLARYYFPDNTKPPPHEPYIQWDGHVNQEIFSIPYKAWLQTVTDDVFHAGLAYFWTGNVTFAEMGVRRVRDWWVRNETAVTPHLMYADWVKGVRDPYYPDGSVIPGMNVETGGIIDMSKMYQVFDGLSLLSPSNLWTPTDTTVFTTWLTRYANWLLTSPRGIAELQNQNNHATWFDVQYYSILLHLRNTSTILSSIKNQTLPRLPLQILPTGQQPLETSRPLSWHYSNYNLQGLFILARLASSIGVNLYDYSTSDGGGSIKKALDYLIPHALSNGTTWPFANVGEFEMDIFAENLKEGFLAYRER